MFPIGEGSLCMAKRLCCALILGLENDTVKRATKEES
jgi:hypothetical protein